MSNTQCSEPFITEELYVASSTLAQRRISEYNRQDKRVPQINQLDCNMADMENKDAAVFGERGVFCPLKEYVYPYVSSGQHISIDDGQYVELLSHDFHIAGIKGEPMTYYITSTIGFDFLTGAGIKAFLVRKGMPIESCLMKNTCI